MNTSAADSIGSCTKCGAGPERLTWGHCSTCWAAVSTKRSQRMSAGPTAIYRLFNEWGDLLYIGSSNNLETRFRDHRKRMPWWHQVDHSRTRVEWLDCGHGGAHTVEHAAIRVELPWYNRSGIDVSIDAGGAERWPNLPPGCPPQPWYTHRPKAEYRPVWREWFIEFRDCMLNPEERAALGRLPVTP